MLEKVIIVVVVAVVVLAAGVTFLFLVRFFVFWGHIEKK